MPNGQRKPGRMSHFESRGNPHGYGFVQVFQFARAADGEGGK